MEIKVVKNSNFAKCVQRFLIILIVEYMYMYECICVYII